MAGIDCLISHFRLKLGGAGRWCLLTEGQGYPPCHYRRRFYAGSSVGRSYSPLPLVVDASGHREQKGEEGESPARASCACPCRREEEEVRGTLRAAWLASNKWRRGIVGGWKKLVRERGVVREGVAWLWCASCSPLATDGRRDGRDCKERGEIVFPPSCERGKTCVRVIV